MVMRKRHGWQDERFPAAALETMAQLLVHETLKTRKMVISFWTAWLKILKPRPNKVSRATVLFSAM